MREKTWVRKVWSAAAWFASRTFILYLVAFVVVFFAVDLKDIRNITSMRTLNRLRPGSFAYLTDMYDQNKPYDASELDQYIFYYQNVAKYLPDRADVRGIWGFTLFHSGRLKEAENAYRKSVELQPAFFWTRFNLAVILFEKGQYQEVISVLEPAMTVPVEFNLRYIQQSTRIYLPLVLRNFSDPKVFGEFLLNELREGKGEAAQLLILSYYREGRHRVMLDAARYALASGVGNKAALYFYAGLAAGELKNLEEAAVFFKASIEAGPTQPQPYEQMAALLKVENNEAMAEPIMRRAKLLEANNARVDYFNPGPFRLRLY